MSKVEPCCPVFDPEPFEDKELTLDDKHFVQETVYCFFHIPLTFGRMTNRVNAKLVAAGAQPEPKDTMVLQCVDPCSPWWAHVYITATKEEVPGATMTKLSGTYLTKVYEGPYSDTGKWVKDMHAHVEKKKGKAASKMFAWYTTCPKCIKVHGKNYVVLLAQIEG